MIEKAKNSKSFVGCERQNIAEKRVNRLLLAVPKKSGNYSNTNSTDYGRQSKVTFVIHKENVIDDEGKEKKKEGEK